MIKLLNAFLGYCHICQQPATVGEFVLNGWKHHFNICEHCLDSWKSILTNASVEVTEKPDKSTLRMATEKLQAEYDAMAAKPVESK